MKRKLLVILFILYCSTLLAQKRGNIWCFGDSAGIDFNYNPPQPITSSVNARGSCASIADTSGSLLFYANTFYLTQWYLGNSRLTSIWNKNNNLLQYGDSIIGQSFYQELCITSMPDDFNKYYLFTTGTTMDEGIHFNIIDITLNSGLGSVIQKNILLDSLDQLTALTAIKHGNGRDWWVLIHDWNGGNIFYKFLVTPLGITGPFLQSIGNPQVTGIGFFKVSNDGSKLIILNQDGLVQVFDFDRCSGNLSNTITASTASGPVAKKYFGCSFSPNNRFIYISNNDTAFHLDQYDLQAANVPASKIIVSQFNAPSYGGFHHLGPDGKIYISSFYDSFWYPFPDSVHNMYSDNLSVINEPDSLGIACDFQPFSFYLGGKRAYWGLPNNPNYDLGPLVGSGCDTLTGVSSIKSLESRPELFVTYVSSWNKIFINAQNIKGKNCLLQIFDMNGKEIFSLIKTTAPPYFMQEVSLSDFSSGMYIVKLTTEKETLSKKFAKE